MVEKLPDSFEQPLCTALTQPVLIAGLPRGFAIALGTVTAALTLAMHLWVFGGAVGLVAYAAGRYVTSRDPYGFQCWAKHLRQPSIFEA